MTGQQQNPSNATQLGVPIGKIGHLTKAKSEKDASACVNIVDDDESVRDAIGNLLRSMGYRVALFKLAADFLESDLPNSPSCLVSDVRLPHTSGLELQQYLNQLNVGLPVILMTAFGDIPMSVKGMKAGAVDFLAKPIRDQDLLDAVATAIQIDERRRKEAAITTELQERYALLTPRERQVLALVASGLMNKHVALELSISEVTVKMHRSSAMRKLGLKSVASLARINSIVNI
jgi:FixJ family two-component response regulator